jgi:hypothetical protein
MTVVDYAWGDTILAGDTSEDAVPPFSGSLGWLALGGGRPDFVRQGWHWTGEPPRGSPIPLRA